mmetsp:Transcript_11149/g.22497  ORF Transcript_11149/g.22497 Transcript_11149/m.22497 type:complete len:228 (-) Transcript_11149:212-895(-)
MQNILAPTPLEVDHFTIVNAPGGLVGSERSGGGRARYDDQGVRLHHRSRDGVAAAGIPSRNTSASTEPRPRSSGRSSSSAASSSDQGVRQCLGGSDDAKQGVSHFTFAGPAQVPMGRSSGGRRMFEAAPPAAAPPGQRHELLPHCAASHAAEPGSASRPASSHRAQTNALRTNVGRALDHGTLLNGVGAAAAAASGFGRRPALPLERSTGSPAFAAGAQRQRPQGRS